MINLPRAYSNFSKPVAELTTDELNEQLEYIRIERCHPYKSHSYSALDWREREVKAEIQGRQV